MEYVTGITATGERLRFEAWAYRAWIGGALRDPDLIAQFRRCVRFTF